jgi:hypothetical protein
VPYRWFEDGRFEVQGAGFPAWGLDSANAKQIASIWQQWGEPIQAAADKYGIPASWLVAIMKIETGGVPRICSSAGACGLMQFMPGTCKMYGHDCSYYNDNPAAQIADAADLLVNIKAKERGGCILGAVKGYNGGSSCGQAGGINTSNPGVLNMYGENNYVEGFVRAANTFAAMGLASATGSDGRTTPPVVQAIVVAGILGVVAYMFADLHWGLTERIAASVGLDRWNA